MRGSTLWNVPESGVVQNASWALRKRGNAPALKNLMRPTSTPIFSLTTSFSSLLSTSKGAWSRNAASSWRSRFRSACSMSQSHTKGGSWGWSGGGEDDNDNDTRSPVKGDPFKLDFRTPLVCIECELVVGGAFAGGWLSTGMGAVNVSVGSTTAPLDGGGFLIAVAPTL